MPIFQLPARLVIASPFGVYPTNMTIYTGFDPGTYQPWALNLLQDAMGSPGVARGMQVVPASTPDMTVVLTTDKLVGDGVCVLSNGTWVRIDSDVTLNVPSNPSGSARTDAVVALVDPTGATTSTVYYAANWTRGFSTPKGSAQLVLAQVTVPASATSIVESNIIQTPLQANIGTAPPLTADAVAVQNAPDTSQPEVFTQYNVVLTPSATNGQTTFTVPLSTMQRLVPSGYIGGAKERGFFAGTGGMYVPQLRGSTSGPLPVASLDHVNGTITSRVGALPGEQVTASFKYYDFSRDLRVWAGEVLLEANSSYIVYQGDVLPGTLHLTGDVWDTETPGFLPETLPLSVIYTFFGKNIRLNVGLPNGSKNRFLTSVDGGGTTNWDVNGAYTYGPVSANYNFSGLNVAIHTVTLQVTAGTAEIGGPRILVDPTNATLYVDGGIAVVNGNTVFVGNTSVPISSAGIGTVYVDHFGNISTAFSVMGKAEQYAGRVPILPSTQYGAQVSTSTTYGLYAHVTNPYHYPAYVTAGRYGISTLPGSTLDHGMGVGGNPASRYGGYLVSSSSGDGLAVQGVCTGADLITLGPTNVSVLVQIDNVTSYGLVIPAATSGAARVRTVTATALPYGSHSFVYDVVTGNSSVSFEAVDLRMPAWPSTPAGTLPLASFWAPGPNAFVKRSLRRAIDLTEISSGHVQAINDVLHFAPGPSPVFTNVYSGNRVAQTVDTSGAFRLSYTAFPSGGQFNLNLDNVSTVATIDTYSPLFTMTTTPWYTVSNGLHKIGVYSTSTKNTSSSGYGVIPTAVEHVALPVMLFDRRRFPVDGRNPSIHGSGLLSAHGAALPNAGYGISTDHLKDRAVTSRKFTPTWNKVVATAAISSFPNFDVLSCPITVEVPSLLWARYEGSINIPAASFPSIYLAVDGTPTAGTNMLEVGGTGGVLPVSLNDMVPVMPGTHVVQAHLGTNPGNGAQPYIVSGLTRTLTVVAFAL